MPAVDRESEWSVKRDQWAQKYLKPAAERPTSTARGVHHMALICSDVERTIRFYQDVVGFPLIELMENRDYKGSTHLFFDIGHGNLLAFFDFPGLGLQPGVESLGSVQHIAISCGYRHARGRIVVYLNVDQEDPPAFDARGGTRDQHRLSTGIVAGHGHRHHICCGDR